MTKITKKNRPDLNKSKIILYISIVICLAALFMSALTFNYVGNKIYSPELIAGFVLSTLTFIIAAGNGFYIQKHHFKNWLYIPTLAIIILFIIAIAIGTIGYLNEN